MRSQIRVRPVSRSVVVYDPPGEGLPALAVALNGANAVYVEAFATVDQAEAATAAVYQAAFGPKGQASHSEDDADLLYGVPAIAAFLGLTRHQAQHRIDEGALPTFRLGGKKGATICASKDALRSYMASLMAAAAQPAGGEHGHRN